MFEARFLDIIQSYRFHFKRKSKDCWNNYLLIAHQFWVINYNFCVRFGHSREKDKVLQVADFLVSLSPHTSEKNIQ